MQYFLNKKISITTKISNHLRYRLLETCLLRVSLRQKFLFFYLKIKNNKLFLNKIIHLIQVFLRCLRDPIRVPRIENRVPRIRENYHRVPRIIENRVPRIREIRSLKIHIGYLTFSLKKTDLIERNKVLNKFYRRKNYLRYLSNTVTQQIRTV